MTLYELGYPHYNVEEIKSMREVREIFNQCPNKTADRNNWLFIGTGGFHGSKESLDDLEEIILGARKHKPLPGGKWGVTILILQTLTCRLRYGHIDVDLDEIDYLRGLCRATLKEIYESQSGSV